MSEMEYNKGRLVKELRSIKEVAEDEIILCPKYYNSKEEYFLDCFIYETDNYILLDDILYRVEWDVRQGELDQINNVSLDGEDILFETYHYNGGGHWSELVESKINKLEE